MEPITTTPAGGGGNRVRDEAHGITSSPECRSSRGRRSFEGEVKTNTHRQMVAKTLLQHPTFMAKKSRIMNHERPGNNTTSDPPSSTRGCTGSFCAFTADHETAWELVSLVSSNNVPTRSGDVGERHDAVALPARRAACPHESQGTVGELAPPSRPVCARKIQSARFGARNRTRNYHWLRLRKFVSVTGKSYGAGKGHLETSRCGRWSPPPPVRARDVRLAVISSYLSRRGLDLRRRITRSNRLTGQECAETIRAPLRTRITIRLRVGSNRTTFDDFGRHTLSGARLLRPRRP